MKKEISSRADVELLVDEFYKKVLKDEIIAYIFTEVVQLSWEVHIPIMYDFWETILLDKISYKGNPMLKHIALDKKEHLTEAHFERWLKLFFETLDENFVGEKAEEAKKRANGIAQMMLFKIQQTR